MDFRRKNYDERTNTSPSKVIHVRELAEHTLEIDVYKAFEIFGPIKDVVMIPKRRQALVEFQDISSAQDLVKSYKNDYVIIGGKPAKVNYSTSEGIKKIVGQSETSKNENKVLIFFIYDAIYPINVDVLLKICRPHGRVARVYINRKATNLNALVEFFSVEEAIIAKRNLNGADIYSGCCSIKIEFATTERVRVAANTDDTYDFELIVPNNASQSLLGLPNGPNVPIRPGLLDVETTRRVYPNERNFNQERDFRRFDQPMMTPLHAHGRGTYPSFEGGSMESATYASNGPKVAMIYNLQMDIINCDKVFNLACLYGNVEKIKFLKSKEGSAMIQMGDHNSAECIIKHLDNSTAFGNLLQLHISKQPALNEVKLPYDLPDGSPSYKDFTNSKENRFLSAEFASRNRICAPTKTLNYWNAPPKFTIEQLNDELVKYNSPLPVEFHQLTDREKSSSGLIQFESAESATECLILCNHMMVQHHDFKFPYQLKLSFSENPIRLKGEPLKRSSDFDSNQHLSKRFKN